MKPEETAFVGDGGSGELAGARRADIVAFQALWFLRRWPHFDPKSIEPGALNAPADVAHATLRASFNRA